MFFTYIANILSKCSSYLIVFAVIYFLLKYTIFRFIKLNKYILINKFYLDDILCIILSFLVIKLCVTVNPIYTFYFN